MPEELGRRETRLRADPGSQASPGRARERGSQEQGQPEEKAKPKDKMQYNFTDPESRIMKGADGFVQAYNAQVAVEPELQLIVGQR